VDNFLVIFLAAICGIWLGMWYAARVWRNECMQLQLKLDRARWLLSGRRDMGAIEREIANSGRH